MVTNPEAVEVTANIVIYTAEGEEQRTLTIPASGTETLPFNVEDETVFEIGSPTPLEAFIAGKTAGGAMSYSNGGLCTADDDGAEAGMAKPMVAPAVAAVIAAVIAYVARNWLKWVAKAGVKYAVGKALDYAKSKGLVHCPSSKNVTGWEAMKAVLLRCTY